MMSSLGEGVHHIALGALDVASVAHFYETALGLQRHSTHEDEQGQLRSIWLCLGPSGATNGVLMIEKTELPRPSDRSQAGVVPGWFLLAFPILASERKEAEARIERAGAVIEERTAYSSYARDPEGNRFAVSGFVF
jgi:glyoxylase I family protein